MLREMRPSELGEWSALFRSNPWGEQRADLRAGIIASAVANSMAKKRDGTAFKPKDFMPYLDLEKDNEADSLSRRLRAAFVTTKKPRG
jgi:hypothetical protein